MNRQWFRRAAVAATLAVLATVSMASSAAPGRTDLPYLAEIIQRMAAAGLGLPDVTRLNDGLDAAAAARVGGHLVNLERQAGRTIAGFKGGFIPRAPVGGVLFLDGIIIARDDGPTVIPLATLGSPLVEVEVAFRFCASVRQPLPDVTALKAAVCSVMPAVELPDASYPDLPGLLADFPRLRRALLATNVAAGHILLGPARATAGLDLAGMPVTITRDGEALGSRSLTPPVADLWSQVLWVVNDYVIASDRVIGPGLFVIPGSLTGLHPGAAGHYRVNYGPLGSLEFVLEPNESEPTGGGGIR